MDVPSLYQDILLVIGGNATSGFAKYNIAMKFAAQITKKIPTEIPSWGMAPRSRGSAERRMAVSAVPSLNYSRRGLNLAVIVD